MLLAVDIGNSNIVLGVYDQNSWQYQWRLETSLQKDVSSYALDISSFFLEAGLKLDHIDRIIMSSVVPPLSQIIQRVLQDLFGNPPLLLGPDLYHKIPMAIDRPHEIGSDLVANAIAAHHKYKKACIVVDFGTALTFTVVSKKGQILGVSIAPGLKTAMYSLFEQTAQLPDVPLDLPPSVIGKNTVHALQAGVLWGYVGLVEFMLLKMKEELKVECKVIATGGLSKVIPELESQFDEIDPFLTLNGLKVIQEFVASPR